MHELIFRRQCAEATLAQYTGAPATGPIPCLRMAVSHVRRMGHRVSLLKVGNYKTPKAAASALKALGFDSLEAALDARFDRIPPAMALVGDIIALPGMDDFPALAIQLDNSVVLHTANGGYAISRPLAFVGAWRVPCKMKASKIG